MTGYFLIKQKQLNGRPSGFAQAQPHWLFLLHLKAFSQLSCSNMKQSPFPLLQFGACAHVPLPLLHSMVQLVYAELRVSGNSAAQQLRQSSASSAWDREGSANSESTAQRPAMHPESRDAKP